MKTYFLLTSYLLLLTFYFLSCSPEDKKPPANLIPMDKMVNILADIHYTESATQLNLKNPQNIDSKQIIADYQNYVFKFYKIDSITFRNSLEYYVKNLELLDEIYLKIIEKMVEKEAKIGKEK